MRATRARFYRGEPARNRMFRSRLRGQKSPEYAKIAKENLAKALDRGLFSVDLLE